MVNRPPVSDDILTEHRAQFVEFMDALAKIRKDSAEIKSVETRDVQIDEKLRARIYIPPPHPTTSSYPSDELPIGLYIHSGGWYTGSISAEDSLCRDIAFNSRIVLISPEYRLAPENPFPAGLEDCFKAYEYMYNHAPEFGASQHRKFIMGASAGGNLSASVALKFASDPELRASGLLVSCMTSCDPSALPVDYKDRYHPENYVDTPVINTNIKQLSRGKLTTY